MRKAMILIIGGLIVVMLAFPCWSQNVLNDDECGKVIIQLMDKKTEQTANEVFEIYFFRSLDNPLYFSNQIKHKIETNKKGYWSDFFDPGIYYLWVLPKSNCSIYETEPSPFLSKEILFQIKVVKGEITKVFKYVDRSGKIKIVLVDPSGNRIIPNEYMNPDVDLRGTLTNFDLLNFYDGQLSVKSLTCTGSLEEGKLVLGRLYPGNYILDISFPYGGYGSIRIENIEVERENTIEKKIIINMEDKTGIEGYVKDENGNPISNYDVILEHGGSIKTQSNGYYRIIGLHSKEYRITVSYTEGYKAYFTGSQIVKIINGIIIRKDFVAENLKD